MKEKNKKKIKQTNDIVDDIIDDVVNFKAITKNYILKEIEELNDIYINIYNKYKSKNYQFSNQNSDKKLCTECDYDIITLTFKEFDVFKKFFNHQNIYVNSMFNILVNINSLN